MATQTLAAQLRAKRSEMMVSEVEIVALRLFRERGFHEVTVDQIAAEAQISVRTFYRYFTSKDDVLQVRIDRRSAILRAGLAARPDDEPPFESLRVALADALALEDMDILWQWMAVIAETPNLLHGVLGGILLKTQVVIAEFLAARLDQPPDALVPTMLAAAAGGVMQAAHTNWYLNGGDLTTGIADGLTVLERGIDTEHVR